MNKKTVVVACSHCAAEVMWDSESRFRPFCSERCKMIDLGQWANEKYRIPENAPTDQDGDLSGQA